MSKYVIDIDGVIASIVDDLDYSKAKPIRHNIARFNKLYDRGHQIVYFTARGTETGIDWSRETASQLKRWGVKYHNLLFGKPAADYYIDDKLISAEEVDMEISDRSKDLIIIGEIGINHNGSLEIAMELIKHAHECGCDVVKFQKRSPDICVPEHQKKKMKYDTPWGDLTYIEYKYKIEFGKAEYDKIDAYCKELGIEWTASVWDVPSAHFLTEYDIKYNKIPSAMLTNKELLKVVADQGRHTFISTGMSTMEDIDKAVAIFDEAECSYELMHSVATYPMKNEHANLNVIKTLKAKYNCPVGWSGHEEGLQVSIAAVAVGADSIERHITLSRSMWGSDHAASLGKGGLMHLVRDCRIVRTALGDGVKRMVPEEEEKRKSLRG